MLFTNPIHHAASIFAIFLFNDKFTCRPATVCAVYVSVCLSICSYGIAGEAVALWLSSFPSSLLHTTGQQLLTADMSELSSSKGTGTQATSETQRCQ